MTDQHFLFLAQQPVIVV